MRRCLLAALAVAAALAQQGYEQANPAPAPAYPQTNPAPAPAPAYPQANPAPAPAYPQANPAPAPAYPQANPAPAPAAYGQANPAPAPQGYGQANPAPAPGGYGQANPAPAPGGYGQANPAPAPQGYGQANPAPAPGGYGAQPPAPGGYGGQANPPAFQPQPPAAGGYGGQQSGGYSGGNAVGGYGGSGGSPPAFGPQGGYGGNSGCSGGDTNCIPLGPTQGEGQCSFDANAWITQPNSAIAKAVMFDRQTGVTCEECLANCAGTSGTASPWQCKSLTYDHRWQICDLYAVKATASPPGISPGGGYGQPPAPGGYGGQASPPAFQPQPPAAGGYGGQPPAPGGYGQANPAPAPGGYGQSNPAPAPGGYGQSNPAPAPGGYGQANPAPAPQGYRAKRQAGYGGQPEPMGYGQANPAPAPGGYGQANPAPAPGGYGQSNPAPAPGGYGGQTNPPAFQPQPPAAGGYGGSSSSGGYGGSSSGGYGGSSSSGGYGGSSSGGYGQHQPQQPEEYKLVSFPGRDYFELIGTPSTPSGSACGANEVRVYFVMYNVEYNEAAASTTDASSISDCSSACSADSTCLSFGFDKAAKSCSLYTSALNPADAIEDQVAAAGENCDKVYGLGQCISSDVAAAADPPITDGQIGEIIPNRIVVGRADQLSQQPDLASCIAECFTAQSADFNCRAGHFYPNGNDNNCILIADDRFARAEAFGPEFPSRQPMFYFGPVSGDADASCIDPLPAKAALQFLADSPISENEVEWTNWTPCVNGTRYTYRYEMCGEKDVTKCMRQVQMCPVSACQPEVNVCKAVCNWDGKIKCPHGRMLTLTGEQVACEAPVDCAPIATSANIVRN